MEKYNKALVLTNHLECFAGSEILSLEVAETLLKMGYDVTIHCNLLNNSMRTATNRNIKISDSDRFPNIFDYSFVWSQHCLIPISIDQHGLPKEFHTKIVSAHLSPYEPFEIIGLNTALILGSEIVANSNETVQKLLKFGVNQESIRNCFNACPDEFWSSTPIVRKNLRRILIVSNHPPEEILEAMRILRSARIDVMHVGSRSIEKRISSSDISSCDAVVTIGKTVQYSFKGGVPVYCYDQFGGPGWIRTSNFERAEMFNFSGRCCNEKKTACRIVEEVISGYEPALVEVQEIRNKIKDKYSLEKFLNNVTQSCGTLEVKNKMPHHIKEKTLRIQAAHAYLIRRLYRASRTNQFVRTKFTEKIRKML